MGHLVMLVPRVPWVYQGTPATRSRVLSAYGHLRNPGDGKTHLRVSYLNC